MNRFASEDAASAVEYGLFLALIAAVIVGVVTALGIEIRELFASLDGAF